MVSRKGFIVTTDPKVAPADAIPRFGEPHPAGQRTSTATGTVTLADRSGDEFDQFKRHARDFLECIRSRRDPISDLESAHRVVTACHLANLSLRLGRKLRWDAGRESVVGDSEADALLERPYRAPWDAQRKALVGTS
jgi:hypothetical protein